MKLIPVVFKRSRLKYHLKYAGGVLNPNKQYYVRRISGNSNPINQLQAIAEGKQEHV